jgi:hypothetical protein
VRPLALGCALALVLGACMRQAPLPPPSARAPVLRTPEEKVGMESLEAAPAPAPLASAPLAAGLPARLREALPLRAQPLNSAAVLTELPAGSMVSILGEIDNASGHWSSVRAGDTVGWLPSGGLDSSH